MLFLQKTELRCVTANICGKNKKEYCVLAFQSHIFRQILVRYISKQSYHSNVKRIWNFAFGSKKRQTFQGGTLLNILLVEDDPLTSEGIFRFLNSRGYQVLCAPDGEAGLALFQQNSIHLMILDIMLPNMDGIQVLRQVRKTSQIPILMLTALSDEQAQLESFDAMADDYICKPFSLLILEKRITALLRRHYAEQRLWKYGGAEVDFTGFSATYNGGDAQVKPKEIRLLAFLLEHRGQVLTREQILDQIWQEEDGPFERVIDTYIKNLRKKLHLNCIVTIKGVGYKIEP